MDLKTIRSQIKGKHSTGEELCSVTVQARNGGRKTIRTFRITGKPPSRIRKVG